MVQCRIQSCTQSPQASCSAGGRPHWLPTGILQLTVLSFITADSQWTANQKKKKERRFFPLPQSLFGDRPLTKKPDDSGNETVGYFFVTHTIVNCKQLDIPKWNTKWNLTSITSSAISRISSPPQPFLLLYFYAT